MPSNESLQQFNDLLIETGNEPAIAAERGEQVEDVAAPQPGEFEVGSPADAALSSAEDFFSNLAESIEESETGDDIDGLSPPEDDFLNDLGLGDEEPPVADFGFDDSADDFDMDQPGGDFDFDLDSATAELASTWVAKPEVHAEVRVTS
jgi:hypothetical protein